MERPEPVRVCTCPVCGSRAVDAIRYGMPDGDPEQSWPANVAAGGCILSSASPDRVCNTCGHAWRSAQ